MGICIRAEIGALETPTPPIDVGALVASLQTTGEATIPLDPPVPFTDLAAALNAVVAILGEVYAKPGNGKEIILLLHR